MDVLKYARDNNIHLFHLPSHSSHVTQPLDVCVFGVFKPQMTEALASFRVKNGMQMSVKNDIVRDCWEAAFTPANILASFSGPGIFPVDKEKVTDMLPGRGRKRKERFFDRPPLSHPRSRKRRRNKGEPGPPRRATSPRQGPHCDRPTHRHRFL